VAIQNLMRTEEAIRTYDTSARLSPPLRSEADRQALIEGVRDGTIDAIVSNHRRCPAEDKEVPFAEAEPGAPSLPGVLPAALTALPAEVAIEALTTRAARCFRLETRGLTLFDPRAGVVLHKHAVDSIITTVGGS
jgi:dihydroorotase